MDVRRRDGECTEALARRQQVEGLYQALEFGRRTLYSVYDANPKWTTEALHVTIPGFHERYIPALRWACIGARDVLDSIFDNQRPLGDSVTSMRAILDALLQLVWEGYGPLGQTTHDACPFVSTTLKKTPGHM